MGSADDRSNPKGEEHVTYYRVVSKNVANNSVARLIAREKLKVALINQKIALYMAQPGEDCTELLEGLALTLKMIGVASEFEPKIRNDDPRLRLLRGGLSACQQLILADGRYDPEHTVAICRALDEAEELNKHVSPKALQRAFIACQTT